MVRILYFHCQGPRFNPWLGNSDPARHGVWLKEKKKEKKGQSGLVKILNSCVSKDTVY